MTAISLTDFGKRDYRNTLVSTEINQFLPFSGGPAKHTECTSSNSKTRVRNIFESKRKGAEEKESSRKIFLDLKKIVFTRTKLTGLWIPTLRETTTATGAPPDEYERPDDLKEISINRIVASNAKAMQAADLELSFQDRLSPSDRVTQGAGKGVTGLLPFAERLKMSVFGQILEGIKHWDDRPLRRSFAHMQDAGQARAFFVKFTGSFYGVVWCGVVSFMSYHIMSCHVMSCHVMSCHVMSCHVVFCISILSFILLNHSLTVILIALSSFSLPSIPYIVEVSL
jgi:hypothetical protein